jgi:hypothetical protein
MIVRRRVDDVLQKVVIGKEIMKVKGNYKVIIIKKDDFYNFLKTVKLRVLNKEYEALMPPLGDMRKNTIDVNGLSVLMSQFMSAVITKSGSSSATTPAQMVLTTQSGTVTFTYTGSVNLNSQGVSVYLQIFEGNGNFVVQYYYVGYDTTDASYTTSQIELYASASIANPGYNSFYTDIVRIAYANASFTKNSDCYLFIVWLVQFQNIPQYAMFFIPTLQNNLGIAMAYYKNNSAYYSCYNVYFNNGSCNFTCCGNCPSGRLTGFVIYVQDNNIVMEFPVMVGLGGGTSTAEMLVCYNIRYAIGAGVAFNISGNFSTTLSPPVSGGTFYLVLATMTVIFQTS